MYLKNNVDDHTSFCSKKSLSSKSFVRCGVEQVKSFSCVMCSDSFNELRVSILFG